MIIKDYRNSIHGLKKKYLNEQIKLTLIFFIFIFTYTFTYTYTYTYTFTMYKSELSDYELKEFIRIHKEFLLIGNKHYNITSFEFPRQKINKNKQTDILYPILKKKKVYEILDLNQFDYNKNQYYIEFHQRNCSFEKRHIISLIGIKMIMMLFHIKYIVHYFILEKIAVKGGNLLYKENGKQLKHIVRSGNILSFKGDLMHFPQQSNGFGCRYLIVLFVKRN